MLCFNLNFFISSNVPNSHNNNDVIFPLNGTKASAITGNDLNTASSSSKTRVAWGTQLLDLAV